MHTRVAIVKKTDNYKCWHDCGEIETLKCCWYKCKIANNLENNFQFFKKLSVELLYHSEILLQVIYPGEIKINVHIRTSHECLYRTHNN